MTRLFHLRNHSFSINFQLDKNLNTYIKDIEYLSNGRDIMMVHFKSKEELYSFMAEEDRILQRERKNKYVKTLDID